jgi:uncharacterized lipoprotein
MLFLFATLTLVAGCRSSAELCDNKSAAYASAESIPPLKIPVGLETPDTRNALRIPDLNSPEPPPRRVGEGCLDEPPKYTTPTAPKPAPAT